jgi:hypothetical protein
VGLIPQDAKKMKNMGVFDVVQGIYSTPPTVL